MLAWTFSPWLEWTLIIPLFLLVAVLSVFTAGQHGAFSREFHGIENDIVAFFVIGAFYIVIAPLYLIWVLFRWGFHQFTPEGRQKHAEAVQQRQASQKAKKRAQETAARRAKLYADAKSDPSLAAAANQERVEELFEQTRPARFRRSQKSLEDLKGFVTQRIYDGGNSPSDTPLGRHIQNMRDSMNLSRVQIIDQNGTSDNQNGTMRAELHVGKLRNQESIDRNLPREEFVEVWKFVGSPTGWLLDDVQPQPAQV